MLRRVLKGRENLGRLDEAETLDSAYWLGLSLSLSIIRIGTMRQRLCSVEL